MDEVVVSNEGGMEMEAKEAEMKMETQTEAEIERSKKKGDGDGGGYGSASAAAAAAAASSVVRWERFLPKMVLRVLLVEADDSTRQIIAALLRKCSYRVAAVSDGLKAWEVLKGRPHNIDLILTEVDLPSISGFALLTLIMEHEICKNIPVIMMSSQDSVSTVYKCMLRGAADFLVKPVRKNELRNLWQHVWRKQASTGGGHGPPDESVAQQKLEATAENNDVSNPSSGYMASDQRNRECIEKESDAQSSCTKPDMDSEGADVECMQRLSQPKRRKSLSSNINMQQKEEGLVASKDFQMQDADAAGSRAAAGANCCQAMTQLEDRNVDEHWRHGKSNVQTSESNHILANPSREAIDFIGAFDNYAKHMYRSSGSDVGANKIDSSRPFELSLRRSHPSGFVNLDTDDRHKLNHSDGSAFSRYVCRTFQPQQSTSRIACNQQKGYESSYDKQLTNHTPDYYSDTHAATANSQRHVSLATGQPGQAETTFTFPQQRVLPAPTPVRGTRFENLSNAYGPMVPLIFCMQSGPSPMQSPGSVGHQGASFQANTFHSQNQQARNSQQYNGLTDQITNDAIDQSENKQEHKVDKLENHRYFSSATDQSANSSFCNGNVSQLHSISYGSNGKVNPVIKVTSECGKEEASPTHGNSHQSMQREAALTKFRLKRKERCYGKKVRYESRKKLAEQRPRVKGQFVRQAHDEPPPGSL